jgi:hypothetical protein
MGTSRLSQACFLTAVFLLINSARIGNKSDTIAKNITAETVSPSYQI